MTHAIRRATSDEADLAAIARIVDETSPEDPTSVEELRWADATYPGGVRFLAEIDGRPVGAATVGRIYMHPPEFPGFWATLDVLPEARRQGIGTGLLIGVSDVARAAGKRELHVPAIDSRPEAVEFLLHRGFREVERASAVELPLAGMRAPSVDPPPGVVVHALADRPELVAGRALAGSGGVPGHPRRRRSRSPWATWPSSRARDVDRPSIPKDGFFVAVDEGTDAVVGYASLLLVPRPGQTERPGTT